MLYSLKAGLLLFTAVNLFSSGCTADNSPRHSDGLRVVSLAPNITEMIFAVGGESCLVGRTSVCNYPNQALTVPIAGGFGTPSLERLIELKPDVVLEVALADEITGRKIDQLGIRRERITCHSLYDIPDALRAVGRAICREKQADEVARELESAIAERRSHLPDKDRRPRVFVEIWGDPVMTAGEGSFISDLIELAGGINVGDAGGSEYYRVSSEWVIEKDPEVILCLYMTRGASARERVSARPGWAGLTAVRSGRVYDGFPDDVLLRPGPRVMSGIDLLSKAISGGQQE